MSLLVAALIVVAAACIAAGVLYATRTPHDLPSFLPGHLSRSPSKHHRVTRAIVAFAAGGVLLLVAGVQWWSLRSDTSTSN